jgi:integrase
MARRRQHGENSLYERGKRGGRGGQWVAVADLGWRDGKRDRREFTGPTAKEAMAKRDTFLGLRREGFTLPKGRPPTVGEWVTHWLHNVAKPRIDPNTFYRSYRQKCEDYIIPFFAKTRLPDLTVEDIEEWHQHLAARTSRRGTPLSAGTITTAHRILSASLNVAVARRRIPHNPASFVSPPYDRPEPEPPSAAEVDQILDACASWPGGARWVLAILTGLRQGEALGLRWRDVRLAAPASVSVRQALARVDRQSVIKAPKSAKSKRTVPLPARAAAALKAHREAQTVTQLRDALVFTDEAGQPVGSRADWQDWADMLSSLGLPHYRVHDARHAYATMLLEEGADPRLVQDLMGWSTAKMAEIYVHVRPVMHEHARSLLDRRFGE